MSQPLIRAGETWEVTDDGWEDNIREDEMRGSVGDGRESNGWDSDETTNRSNFSTSGILGLALASVSSIYFSIATDDGNALAANLFGMASSASVPSAPFSSRSLRHPGFDDVSSVLSVGVHPSNLVPDPSKVGFSDFATNSNYDHTVKRDLCCLRDDSCA
ncbi:uncharacterized protein B0H18DRAFT_1212280 [Fomitopsis serialis]|uniref:uncharacterized protein n=1 Tax=Fomitopsis serialis TaxID=139415 RepID=UPI002007EFD0|nr:uncharacterized protein B0H18DRAFT_1212280 [Neoantrodia serialis]KAH9923211.1 hypothetical protein B0H18DRAFT_1212280 [Neoantrodia serialis]